VARALVGFEQYTVIDAQENPVGVLTVAVVRTRPEAPCPGCEVFSARVKLYRSSKMVDAPAQSRPCRLTVTKRAFRCDTPGSVRRSFTKATDAVPARRGSTNGRVEGINRVIKHIKRLGYTFTNTDNHRLRILYLASPRSQAAFEPSESAGQEQPTRDL
jgi:transposase